MDVVCVLGFGCLPEFALRHDVLRNVAEHGSALSTSRCGRVVFDDADDAAVLWSVRGEIATETNHVFLGSVVVSTLASHLCRACLAADEEVFSSVAGLLAKSFAYHLFQYLLYLFQG